MPSILSQHLPHCAIEPSAPLAHHASRLAPLHGFIADTLTLRCKASQLDFAFYRQLQPCEARAIALDLISS